MPYFGPEPDGSPSSGTGGNAAVPLELELCLPFLLPLPLGLSGVVPLLELEDAIESVSVRAYRSWSFTTFDWADSGVPDVRYLAQSSQHPWSHVSTHSHSSVMWFFSHVGFLNVHHPCVFGPW